MDNKEHNELVDELVTKSVTSIEKNFVQNKEFIISRIIQLAAMLKGELTKNDDIFQSIDTHWGFPYFVNDYLNSLNRKKVLIQDEHFVTRALLKPKFLKVNEYTWSLLALIREKLVQQPSEKTQQYFAFLKSQGFSDRELFLLLAEADSYILRSKDEPLSAFGEFAAKLIKKKSLLGVGTNYSQLLHNTIFSEDRRSDKNTRKYVLQFLLKVVPQSADKHIQKYLTSNVYRHHAGGYVPTIDLEIVKLLVSADPDKYSNDLLHLTETLDNDLRQKYSVYYLLHKYSQGDYFKKLESLWEDFDKDNTNKGNRIYSQTTIEDLKTYPPIDQSTAELFFSKSQKEGEDFINRFLASGSIIYPSFLLYLQEKFKGKCLPYLLKTLRQETKSFYSSERYFNNFCQVLESNDYSDYVDELLEYCTQRASKKDLEIICKSLSKRPRIITTKAVALLKGKTVKHRIAGALILSHIEEENVKQTLSTVVEGEKNDNTRNVMLEALAEQRFTTQFSLVQVKEMITQADQRKKLAKWSEKFIDEDKFPRMYWKTGGELDSEAIRFLFYRAKQVKGMGIDPELKQALSHIDAEKSPKIAPTLLQAFSDSGSDTKLKYYLTLSGLLGGDEGLTKLNTLLRKSIADKRMKLAEYLMGAIAMIGSDKALRIIEVLSRKYANKKAKFSQKALSILDEAAQEYGMSPDELADKIVPDFDFEGIYKEFDVEEETYRAFVNSDFKLIYYNENNKSRKSIPPKASKELKKEFKEITKEINAVSKSQIGRLEKYLVESRLWDKENWSSFFQGNPIMYVFAMKLLWSVFNEQGKFITGFYCNEDCELLNFEDEEIELEENHRVGIMHPLDMSEEQREAWKAKIYEMSFISVFPTINRTFFTKLNTELEKNVVKRYNNASIPKGADAVAGILKKKAWNQSNGDGGRLVFSKTLRSQGIQVQPDINGPAVFYQGGQAAASLNSIWFRKIGSSEAIKIKDIPDKWFSEVIADLDSLIQE